MKRRLLATLLLVIGLPVVCCASVVAITSVRFAAFEVRNYSPRCLQIDLIAADVLVRGGSVLSSYRCIGDAPSVDWRAVSPVEHYMFEVSDGPRRYWWECGDVDPSRFRPSRVTFTIGSNGTAMITINGKTVLCGEVPDYEMM